MSTISKSCVYKCCQETQEFACSTFSQMWSHRSRISPVFGQHLHDRDHCNDLPVLEAKSMPLRTTAEIDNETHQQQSDYSQNLDGGKDEFLDEAIRTLRRKQAVGLQLLHILEHGRY